MELLPARNHKFPRTRDDEARRQEDLHSGTRRWQLVDDEGNLRRRFIISHGKTLAAEREMKLWRHVRDGFTAHYELRGRPDLDKLIIPGIRDAVMTRHNWQRDS